MKQGMIYIFTGDGKGKTSAALGTSLRAVGAGMKVAWVSWYKQGSWKLSEVDSLGKLGVEVFLMGKGFNIKEGPTTAMSLTDSWRAQDDSLNLESLSRESKRNIKTARIGRGSLVVDTASEDEHKEVAIKALKKASELMDGVDVLVLDEVNNALEDKLISLKGLINLISNRGKTHLILTGRNVHSQVVKIADLVTECKKIKHPYDNGELAIKGLDY